MANHIAGLICAREHAILLIDDEGRYVGANAAACRLLGLSADAIMQMRVGALAPATAADGPNTEQWWRRLLDRGSEVGRLPIQTGEGRIVMVNFYARAHFAAGLHLAMFSPVDAPLAASENGESEAAAASGPKSGPLTPRERDVLGLVAAGLTGTEIAQQLSISPPTVESHVGNAMRKLGATNRAHAIALALSSGLISL